MRAKAYGQSILLLLDVIDVLNRYKVPYAVIGAIAASYYGLIRASLDADAVVSLKNSKASLDALQRALTKGKLKVIVKHSDAEDPLDGLILIEDKHGNQVDLILGIKGMDKKAYDRVKLSTFKDHDMRIIGKEDFIAMKIFAGGSKDIDDVKGVLSVSGGSIDYKLLRKLTLRYGEEELRRLENLLNK